MKDLILITGASSGLGFRMAQQLAEKGYDLIISARSVEKLKSLKSDLQTKHHVDIHVFPSDLSDPNNAVALYDTVKANGLKVTMLVNNAGAGEYGSFADMTLKQSISMIDLNVSSLVTLTRLFGEDMRRKKRGRIMNTASLLSYLTLPYFSVYSATKSFVLAFSENIQAEFENDNVVVSAICPGPVDTAFTTSAMSKSYAYKFNSPADPEAVASAAVAHLLKGKGTKIVGLYNWFLVFVTRITPSVIMSRFKKFLGSQG